MPKKPLADDDERKWIYREHTRAKHEVLHYYLKVWTSIVSDPRFDLRIFDCFAGRADYIDSVGAEPIKLENISSEASYPGSPVLMLDAVSEHADKFKTAECCFMEPIDDNRAILQETLAQTSHPDNVQWGISDSRFPDDMQRLLDDSGGRQGFAFFFIDPFNIKHLNYDTITDIARTPKWDCLITVMTSQLIRWQESDAHQEGYTRFFGLEDWREKLQSFVPDELTTREAEFYCKRLEETGPKYTLAYMTTDGHTRELKYHLVFTTNHEKGMQAMKGSMMRCGGDYTLAYAPQRTELEHDQQRLNGGEFMTDTERAKAWLLSRFAGDEVTFGEICEKAATERRYEELLQKDYRKYLRELHNAGEVSIPDREPPDGSLPDHYVVSFPEVELAD